MYRYFLKFEVWCKIIAFGDLKFTLILDTLEVRGRGRHINIMRMMIHT